VSEPGSTKRAIVLPAGLSFVAGYVDTVGFVALFGLFTAHVTGNFLLIGATLVRGGAGLVTKLLALPVFIIVVAMVTAFVRAGERAGRDRSVAVMTLEIGCLAAFGAVGMWAAPIVAPDAPPAMVAGLLGVCAMAVQNAASRRLFSSMAPTTVMTGNVTQLVIEGVDSGAGTASAPMRRLWLPIVAFAAGAGALLFDRTGFGCVAVPILALALVALMESSRMRAGAR
jgi:uncharacterized membrane protein YoaK (UPF0700 family)